MEEIKLDYFKDMEGNYIVKQVVEQEEVSQKLITSGDYSESIVLGVNFFEKKLKHRVEDIIKSIEENVMYSNKIKREDILSERFVLNIVSERDFNPMFKQMTDKEIATYTQNSKKVRLQLKFEVHFKIKPHLWTKVILGKFQKIKP